MIADSSESCLVERRGDPADGQRQGDTWQEFGASGH
jgi:hypothetical protein